MSPPDLVRAERDRRPGAAAALGHAITAGRDALMRLQAADGHWCFELEADCTIPAEYILMMHFMDEIDEVLQAKLARFLRAEQVLDGHGGWPLYHRGQLDLSCTVKCYYALKLAGDDPQAPHMVRAREVVLARGGAAKTNVFTRIALALFGQLPWRGVPYIPVEIMLLPRWFFFHLDKVSYWSRTVMVPLFILCTLKPLAKNPRRIDIRELFVIPPEDERHYFATHGALNKLFLTLDHLGRALDPLIPKRVRQHAIKAAYDWFVLRLNGEDGLGAIFPAMVNAYEALALLGHPPEDPLRAASLRSIQKLVVQRADGSAYCQPCVSPVWDTGWAALALYACDREPTTRAAVDRALEWLAQRQVTEVKGDWAVRAPDLPPGGWAFQYRNDDYPDLDDTAMVAALLQVIDPQRYRAQVARATDWLVGLQSKNGGFAAFDADNTCYYLNAIPFADHGALLDPPTEDVSGRVLLPLGLLARPRDRQAVRRCVDYLKRSQQPDGSWWGRWGSNFIYGTWSVLAGLAFAGEDMRRPYVRKAVTWLRSRQNADGGWGETNDSYQDPRLAGTMDGESTAYSTAWALLGLMAAGEVEDPAVTRGIDYLLATQGADGLWRHDTFNAPGFPRVFYLKYHGYTVYFPLWALARYRQLLHATPGTSSAGVQHVPAGPANVLVRQRAPHR
ncbi:MAG: squalene--hopene cyclase [Gammaproteobacteria bacterium]|nr:squalene--hopene cyclase [Gammaproteobacteria bacterium]